MGGYRRMREEPRALATRSAAGLDGGADKLPETTGAAAGADAAGCATACAESGGEAGCVDAAAGLSGMAAPPLMLRTRLDEPTAPEVAGGTALESVWLIWISCSRLFTLTSWLMY